MPPGIPGALHRAARINPEDTERICWFSLVLTLTLGPREAESQTQAFAGQYGVFTASVGWGVNTIPNPAYHPDRVGSVGVVGVVGVVGGLRQRPCSTLPPKLRGQVSAFLSRRVASLQLR